MRLTLSVSLCLSLAGCVSEPATHVAPIAPDNSANHNGPRTSSRSRGPADAPKVNWTRLEPANVTRVCSVANEDGRPRLRVEGCGCGEVLYCRIAERDGAAVLEVGQDPETLTLCTACSPNVPATCAVPADSLPPAIRYGGVVRGQSSAPTTTITIRPCAR